MEKKLRRVTVKDIAEKAGVSLSTVHCALSGKSGVGSETRQKILQIADELNYQPNVIAASLKRRTVRIAAVFPALSKNTRFYYTDIWNGIRSYFATVSDLNIEMVEVPYYTYHDSSIETLKDIDLTLFDGILTMGYSGYEIRQLKQRFIERDIPVVLVGSTFPDFSGLCCVKANNIEIGKIMAEILLNQATTEQRLLICAGDEDTPSNFETLEGFNAYVKSYTRQPVSVIKLNSGKKHPDFYDRLVELLSDETQKITGCCCVTAQGSVKLGNALRQTKMAGKIPAIGSDVFDDNVNCLENDVFINIIHKAPFYQAFLASRILTDYILKDITPSEKILYVRSEVVFKSSVHLFTHGSHSMYVEEQQTVRK